MKIKIKNSVKLRESEFDTWHLFFATTPVGLSLLSSRPSSSEVAQSKVRADRAHDGVHEYLVVASMVSELVVALHDHDGDDGRLEQARDDERLLECLDLDHACWIAPDEYMEA